MTRIGVRFAYRERARTPGDPVRPVEVVKEGPPRSQKAKVRRLDGEYEGLEEWVPEVRLVVPWEEVDAFLEDERRMLEAIGGADDAHRTTEYEAAKTVFFALPPGDGSDDVFFGHKAAESRLLVIEDLAAAERRLGIPAEGLLAEPHAYVDRFGEYKAPFGVAVKVAKHCCEAFPDRVLRRVRAEEDALREAITSGRYAYPDVDTSSGGGEDRFEISRTWAEELLAEREPAFALIREWCGQDSGAKFEQLPALRAEVDRLRGLLEDTARWLRLSGHPVKASLLLKDIDRTSEHGHR